MSEAKSPGTWLELADGILARFTGVVADSKRELTQEAKVEMIKQTVQGAHDDLKACKLAVAKLRSENTPGDLAANDLKKSATTQLRRKCKAVHRKASGAILFLERKTQLGDCMVAIDHNNGVANNDVHNNGVANNGVANNGVPNNGDVIGSEWDGLSTSPLCQSNCLALTSPIRASSSFRVIANHPVNPLVDTRLSDLTAYELDETTVDTTAYHPSDTTQPASKKQRVAPTEVAPTEGHHLYLPGGYDPHSAFDFTTTCNSDLLVLNAFDDVSPIALVEVTSEFVIGKTGTALTT